MAEHGDGQLHVGQLHVGQLHVGQLQISRAKGHSCMSDMQQLQISRVAQRVTLERACAKGHVREGMSVMRHWRVEAISVTLERISVTLEAMCVFRAHVRDAALLAQDEVRQRQDEVRQGQDEVRHHPCRVPLSPSERASPLCLT